jgi:hypothetical protein
MNDPVTAETWQTAFGKDFGGMCQGDNKTGTVGTNAMFVMTLEDVNNMPPRQICDVRKDRCEFSTPKRGPEPHLNHGQWQLD